MDSTTRRPALVLTRLQAQFDVRPWPLRPRVTTFFLWEEDPSVPADTNRDRFDATLTFIRQQVLEPLDQDRAVMRAAMVPRFPMVAAHHPDGTDLRT